MTLVGQADFVGFCIGDKDLSLGSENRSEPEDEIHRKEWARPETECGFEHPDANRLSRQGDADEGVAALETE
jgi:hypothetical protein